MLLFAETVRPPAVDRPGVFLAAKAVWFILGAHAAGRAAIQPSGTVLGADRPI